MSRVTTPWFLFVLFALYMLLLVACSPGAPAAESEADVPSATTESDAPATAINEVTFTAREYSFEGPASIPAGWTRLALDNQGELSHDLIPVQLGEGKTMDDIMAALESEGPPEWATIYGQVTAEAGQSEFYLVDLAPGNYVILSFGDSEDGPPDAAQGMINTLTVTEAESEVPQAELPQADVTVDLVDYSFVVDGDIAAGEQLLHVRNTGMELHELSIVHLNEGTTFEDIQAMLESGEEPEGEPPFEDVGFMLLSPGISSYVSLEFDEPGTYVMTCFIPSMQHEGTPHYALGMIQEITIP